MWLVMLLGFICRLFGFHENAENFARKALRTSRPSFRAWRLLGLELAERASGPHPNVSSEQEAKMAFWNAYKVAPRNFPTVWNLCIYLAYLGEIRDAERIASEYAKVDPSRGANLIANVQITKKFGSTRGMSKEDAFRECDETQPPDLC
jgi:Flp pilus assembly protein TadD